MLLPPFFIAKNPYLTLPVSILVDFNQTNWLSALPFVFLFIFIFLKVVGNWVRSASRPEALNWLEDFQNYPRIPSFNSHSLMICRWFCLSRIFLGLEEEISWFSFTNYSFSTTQSSYVCQFTTQTLSLQGLFSLFIFVLSIQWISGQETISSVWS